MDVNKHHKLPRVENQIINLEINVTKWIHSAIRLINVLRGMPG